MNEPLSMSMFANRADYDAAVAARTMTDQHQTHEAIRKALAAGPTPGPWTSISRGAYWDGEEGDVRDSDGNDVEQAEFVKPIGDVFTTRGQMRYVDADYIAACNPEAITALLADRDRLASENDLLRQHAAKQISDATLMTGMAVGNGSIDVGLQGGAAGLLVESFAQQFKDGGGINYLELKFESAKAMPGEAFVVTLQRINGETPTQQLNAARAERDRLAAALAATSSEGEDAARLDWIEARGPNGTIRVDDEIGLCPRYVHWGGSTGLTLRNAIDAARASLEGGDKP